RVQIVDVWPNSEEVVHIVNDAPEPMRAIEIVTSPDQESGDWVPQIEASDTPFAFEGFSLRVVPTGERWSAPSRSAPAVFLDSAKQEHPIPAVGGRLGDTGWTVTAVTPFLRATIGRAGEVTERESGQTNPAMRVTLTHEDGSVEQQLVFERFREQPFVT